MTTNIIKEMKLGFSTLLLVASITENYFLAIVIAPEEFYAVT